MMDIQVGRQIERYYLHFTLKACKVGKLHLAQPYWILVPFPMCLQYGDYSLFPAITGAVVTRDHITVFKYVPLLFLLSIIVIRKNRITFNFKPYKRIALFIFKP